MSADDLPESEAATVPVDLDEDLYLRWLHVKKMLDEARESFDDVDLRIKKLVMDQADGCDARVIVDGEQVGKYTQVFTHRFDSSTFKRQFPDIYAQFQTKSSYWRMSWARGDR